MSAGLDDKHIGSGDCSRVRVTGGKSSCLRIVSDLSELSHCTYSPFARPSTADVTSAFTTFKLFLLALQISFHCFYSGLHEGIWIFVCHSFNGGE